MKKSLVIKSLIGSLLAASLATSGIALAGQCGHSGKRFAKDPAAYVEKRVNRMTQKLSLTTDQASQLKVVLENNASEIKPLREQLRSLKTAMRTLDPASANYDNELGRLALKKSDLVRQITIARGQKRKAVAAILTPEQQAQLKTMHENRRGKFGYKRHKHHD